MVVLKIEAGFAKFKIVKQVVGVAFTYYLYHSSNFKIILDENPHIMIILHFHSNSLDQFHLKFLSSHHLHLKKSHPQPLQAFYSGKSKILTFGETQCLAKTLKVPFV